MKAKQFYNTTAWKWFRKYHILKHTTKEGLIQCRTSGTWYEADSGKIHLGHYIKVYDGNSTNFATAFDDRNVLPQSSRDNRYFSGKPDVMRKELIKDWGEEEIEKLEQKKHNFCRLDKFTLDEIAKEYRLKYRSLKSE